MPLRGKSRSPCPGWRVALERLAALSGAAHGYLPRGGEILELTEPRRRGESGIDAAARLLERFRPYRDLVPSHAWYSGSVAASVPDSVRDNYKTVDGMASIPTAPYSPRNAAEFAAGFLRVVDNVDNARHVEGARLRIGIPPKGFYAVHGDGLLAGPRVIIEGDPPYLFTESRDKKGRRLRKRGDRATTPNRGLWEDA